MLADEALHCLLDTPRVLAQRVPAGLGAQTAPYRNLLAGNAYRSFSTMPATRASSDRSLFLLPPTLASVRGSARH